MWRSDQINTKSCIIFITLGSNVTTFVKEVFLYLLQTRLWQNEQISDEMNQLTLNLVTESQHWDQINQLLLKKFFNISYGLGYFGLNVQWWRIQTMTNQTRPDQTKPNQTTLFPKLTKMFSGATCKILRKSVEKRGRT